MEWGYGTLMSEGAKLTNILS